MNTKRGAFSEPEFNYKDNIIHYQLVYTDLDYLSDRVPKTPPTLSLFQSVTLD